MEGRVAWRDVQGLRSYRLTLDCAFSRRNSPAGPISPNGEDHEKQIQANEGDHVSFAADAEAIAVESFAENEIDSIPRHQDGEKTKHARHHQPKLCPPSRKPSVQRCDVTKKRD